MQGPSAWSLLPAYLDAWTLQTLLPTLQHGPSPWTGASQQDSCRTTTHSRVHPAGPAATSVNPMRLAAGEVVDPQHYVILSSLIRLSNLYSVHYDWVHTLLRGFTHFMRKSSSCVWYTLPKKSFKWCGESISNSIRWKTHIELIGNLHLNSI